MLHDKRTYRTLALSLLLATPAAAQLVNPATSAQSRAEGDQEVPLEEETTGLNTWELPAIVIHPTQESDLFEEDRVGPYAQPRWTTKRLFPSTRVYVVPTGKVEIEHWTRAKVPDEGKSTVETQYELEVGLPGRFQLDLYTVTEKSGGEGELDVSEQKYELRYALADWGELWMNPTVYIEYVSRSNAVDKVEYKLLLGDELAPSWHFGSNLVLEHELGGEGENEYGLTMGISHTILDSKLALGAELKAALLDTHADRGTYEKELEIGPSVRWQPVENMHVDFAPLFGIGADSRAADIFLVLGWEF